jgi:hypothetical protein
MPADYILGLDLGQARDHSALAILERIWKPHPAGHLESHYVLRYLQRWPLQTSFPAVAADLAGLVRTPPLSWPVLVIDQTGVGRAVVDFLIEAHLSASLEPVVISSGQRTSRDASGVWHVPKKALVRSLQVLLPTRRLQVAALPEQILLMQEMLTFRVRLTAAAHETFAARRKRDHDDLVLAVALAAWWGEHQVTPLRSSARSAHGFLGMRSRVIGKEGSDGD